MHLKNINHLRFQITKQVSFKLTKSDQFKRQKRTSNSMEDHLTPPIELGEEMAPMFRPISKAKQYDIKLDFLQRDQIRRIRLQECNFSQLKQAVQKMFPNGNFVEFFYYGLHLLFILNHLKGKITDDEGCKIIFNTDAEMECMFSYTKAFGTDAPKVFVKGKILKNPAYT